MKKFIVLAVLASSTISYASTRSIFDIMYLPSAGTTYGFSQAELIDQEVEFKGGGDITQGGYRLVQTVGHSLTDRLSLQASLNYIDQEQELKFAGLSSDSDATGLSDPKVEARFRIMDETFRWDIIGGAIIGLGDKEVKSNGDVNNKQGGSSLIVGTQFGATMDNMQWAVLGQLTHNLKATTDDKNIPLKYEDESNNAVLLRGDILNKLADKSLLRSFLSVNFTEKFEDDDTPPGVTPPTTTYTIGTEYQHLLSQDLMLRAGVDYGMTNVTSGQIDDFTSWTYRLGANYQF